MYALSGTPAELTALKDEERFHHLYVNTRARVFAYATRRAAHEEALDAVAEAFRIAWQRLDAIPAGLELPWLLAVVRRVLANQRRLENRHNETQHRMRTLAVQPSTEIAETVQVRADLLRLVAELPRPQQEVLCLALDCDEDIDEIAELLGCSRNAVHLRLGRARRALATTMKMLGRRDSAGGVADIKRM